MKVNSKIGDSYRVIIPKEIRDVLHIELHQQVTLEIDDLGRIIIDTNSEEQRLPEIKNTLNIDSLPKGTRYWENGILKVKLDEPIKEEKKHRRKKKRKKGTAVLNTFNRFNKGDFIEFVKPKSLAELSDDELVELKFCPRCEGVVEPNSYIKVNSKFICMSCIKDLKEQLKEDVANI